VVKEIISFYPHLQYVLLGDDSQSDPYIYEQITKIFPKNIKAIYIRKTSKSKNKVVEILKNIESLGVAVCYFKLSNEAIAHSKAIGII
jgi:phosphatidate phosphatase APP1